MKSLLSLVLLALFVFSCSTPTENNEAENNVAMTAPDTSYYLHEADSLIKMTFDTLSKTLKAEMAMNGPHGAVRFCSMKAFPLTGTYQSEFVYLRRTSLQPRNPANTSSGEEKKILEQWQSEFEKGNTPAYGFYTEPGKVHVMRPIFIQPLCLNCHGKTESDIQPKTLAVIDSLYSMDQARNYSNGDLRGAWHLSFFVKD